MDLGTPSILTLLTAPVIGFAAGHRLRSRRPIETIIVCIGAGCAILVTTLTLTTGWSFRGVVLDAATLFLAYFAFCIGGAAAILRIKNRRLRWAAICVFGIPIAAGYLVATVGSLAVYFAAGDYEPVSNVALTQDLSYRTYGFGNATTSHGGTVIQVFYHPRWAPWLERRLLRKAFDFREYDLDTLTVEVREHGRGRTIVVREAEREAYTAEVF